MSVTVKHPFVSTVPDSADTSLVRPSNWNADHTIVGLGTAAELNAGVPNGVATLDSGGKVPVSELPAAVLGALSYQGTWNASTNTPTLASGVGTKGYYYVVSVAGSTNLDGVTDWLIGDWAVYNGTAWQKVDNTDAGGDVVGPASATDNAIARFDTTTGKLIQNSQVLLDDSGNATGLNAVTFDTTPTTPPAGEGSLYWDNSDSIQTLNLIMAGGDATQHIGEETYYRVKASSAITNGQVVMFTGTLGASGGLTAAPATGLTAATASYVMGIATQDIPLNSWGYITHFGEVKQLNTSAFSDGAILYYDPTVAGGLTATLPSAPNAKIQICAVVHSSATTGILFVRPAFGGILGQYEGDVQITTPANGQLLVRDQTAGKWVNTTLTDGTGISITEGAGSVTVTNTAPDQTVALTAGTGISTTGTYPNFTITNTAPSSGGTVTSVGGTGTVNGLTLTGTVTTSGNLTLGGTLDLSSPPAIGGTAAAAGTFTTLIDSYGNVRSIPKSGSAKTTSYTLATTDNGQFIEVGSGGSITIPDATFATGNAVSVFNNTSGNITITCTITTAYIAGTDTDKATVTLATRGVATILFISGTVCVMGGNLT